MKSLTEHLNNGRPYRNVKTLLAFTASFFLAATLLFHHKANTRGPARHRPMHAEALQRTCRERVVVPGPLSDFASRTESDRFEPGTTATLVKNATIWRGRGEGTLQSGDILLDMGIIIKVGRLNANDLPHKYETVEANGAWVTPGIFDMHSHLGLFSAPQLGGAADGNSLVGVTQPWLRSIDALNTHDDAFRLSISGGVTTSLILPGSADAIGGQAYVMKLRPTSERSPSSMLLEPPFTMNSSANSPLLPHRWRHMKHACGENPSYWYGFSRMDTQWSFRKAYNEARKVMKQQDEYCAKIEMGLWSQVPAEYPESLQWEALVDVLRGKVKVNNHCYEAVDFDQQIRLTNEFKFSIVAFHHAHEAYLVPDLLKKMYGAPPAIALFATNARYKRESYRGSEFAPRILSEAGFEVVMKSDHPVLDSRFVLHEAQQAHYYGLDPEIALASVTTTPAKLQGFGHRLGYVKAGYDADIVLWDSHPLALGATPKQVFIDGIPQLESPYGVRKSSTMQLVPKVPNFDKEAKDAVKYDGLPPLMPSEKPDSVMFINVRKLYHRVTTSSRIKSQDLLQREEYGVVLVHRGKFVCYGNAAECEQYRNQYGPFKTIDLEGGVIAPGMLTFGAPIGLTEILMEDSTNDGVAFSPIIQNLPEILGDWPLARATDGLQFQGRDALLAYRNGITAAVTAPVHSNFIGGLSVGFRIGAASRLSKGAILKGITALHVTIRHNGIPKWTQGSNQPSISSQIAALRGLLLGNEKGMMGDYFKMAAKGEIPLLVGTDNADVIATLLDLLGEVSQVGHANIRMTIVGGAEAHLLAKELAQAGVGVIITRPRPFPSSWSGKEILPGLPLSKQGAIHLLLSHNVTVGMGVEQSWQARNTRLDAAWVAIEAGGELDKETTLELISTNLEHLLGLELRDDGDLVAWHGGDMFDLSSKAVAVLSKVRQQVDIL